LLETVCNDDSQYKISYRDVDMHYAGRMHAISLQEKEIELKYGYFCLRALGLQTYEVIVCSVFHYELNGKVI